MTEQELKDGLEAGTLTDEQLVEAYMVLFKFTEDEAQFIVYHQGQGFTERGVKYRP